MDLKLENLIAEILSLLDSIEKIEVIIKEDNESTTMNISNVINMPDSDLEILLDIELDKVEQEKV